MTSWIVRGLGMGGAEVGVEDPEEEGREGLRVVEDEFEDKGAQMLVVVLAVVETLLFSEGDVELTDWEIEEGGMWLLMVVVCILGEISVEFCGCV